MVAADERDSADRRRRYGYSMESRRRHGYPAESRRRHGCSTESRRQYDYSTESRQNLGMGSGRNSDSRNPRGKSDRQRDCYTPRSGLGRERDEDDEEYWEYMERRRKYVEHQRRREAVARQFGVEPLDRRGLSPNRYTDPDPDRLRHYCIQVEFPDETCPPEDLEAYYLSFFPQVPNDTPEHKRPRMTRACDPDIFPGFFALLSPKHLQHIKAHPACF